MIMFGGSQAPPARPFDKGSVDMKTLNPGRRGGKPATNGCSYGAALSFGIMG
jgi:hypothetical protein